jgi:hypothetical protein
LARRIEPGGRREVNIWMRDGYVWKAGADEGSHEVPGYLLCAPMLEVWNLTVGPWDPNAPGGARYLSIRCPPYDHPVRGGAGYYRTPSGGSFEQWAGGFGTHTDGYWDYQFRNWTGHSVWIAFWGVCTR